MEVVGGASVSAKAWRCLYESKDQRRSTRAKDGTDVEALSNMESAPKCDAPPRERARFIFALVCTVGISSVCWAFWGACTCCWADCREGRRGRWLEGGVTDHHVSWLVVGSGLPERVRQRRAKAGMGRGACTPPGIRAWSMGRAGAHHGRVKTRCFSRYIHHNIMPLCSMLR
jgi:hypothetical protein